MPERPASLVTLAFFVVLLRDYLMTILLPEEFVAPDYAGGSIANVPATVAGWLGVPFDGLPPLHAALHGPLPGRVRRVVLLLIDGMGQNLVPVVEEAYPQLLARAAIRGQLTSIFPSTTVAALSSLWTGVAPAQHGLLGLRLFFPELATQGQMIKMSPEFIAEADALIPAGIEPTNFLDHPGVAEQLAAARIPTYSFKGREIVRSALSKMHGRGAKHQFGIVSAADMFVQIARLLEEKPGKPVFASAYWPAVDSLSHYHGYDSPNTAAELRAVLDLLLREFWERLSPAARRDTLLCVLADHGQINTPAGQRIFLADHPALQAGLLMYPAGEPRTAYLYARQGQAQAVLAYIQAHLSHAMVAYPAGEALDAGLFGPPPYSPRTPERLGDLVVVMRDGYALLTEQESQFMVNLIGRHGGMSAAEMLVPWWVFPLDS